MIREGKVCLITDKSRNLPGIKGEGHEKLLDKIFKFKNKTEVTDF
ncbi:MAG: hypothetical protein RHS_0162 [Robinsoniella sp. RHS]|nr:MAG: hypothetical protein RHS_0162 [Robinsoniella sp. RHS]